jgi:CRISPR-associated protein Cmr1
VIKLRQIKEDFLTSPEPPSVQEAGRTTRDFVVELITPMYGGGAKAGINDQDLPIRPTSVRGQLRFWWRATRGAGFNTLQELFAAEEKIWGNVENPSSTRVFIKDIKYPNPEEKFRKRDYWDGKSSTRDGRRRLNPFEFPRSSPQAYVLFPAIEAKDESGSEILREGLSFTFTISYSYVEDVECAVWAWVNFGGIGARTRRGCGALYCQEFAPKNHNVATIQAWFREKIRDYDLQSLGSNRDWPTLSRQVLVHATQQNPLEAWRNAIKPMQDFRQGENIGRRPGSDPAKPLRLGRSFWPEPDTLRNIFGQWCRGAHPHAPKPGMPQGFPRAAFGLPINFHFPCACPSSELRPATANRMGSPIILRPLKTQNNNWSVPMVLHLNASLPAALTPSGPVVDARFSAVASSPMHKRSAAGNAVEAFLRYLQEPPRPGFKMVQP